MRGVYAGSVLLMMLLVAASCATVPPKRLDLYPTLGQEKRHATRR